MDKRYEYVWDKVTECGDEKWVLHNNKKVTFNHNVDICTQIIYNECEGITNAIIAIKGKHNRVLKGYQYVDGTLYELICNAYKVVEHDKVYGVTTIHLEDKKYGNFIDELFGNDSLG